MKIAIHQPQFMPWLGYFHKMANVDLFIFINDVQFKKNEWQNRNRIRSSLGIQWLTVPTTYKFPQKICEVEADFSQPWQKKHIHSLEACYGKSPYYKKYIHLFAEYYCTLCSKIDRINIDSVRLLCGIMGIKTEYIISSNYKFMGESTERLVNICKHFKADTYLAGQGSRDYLDISLFNKAGIKVEFQEFKCPVYAQHWAKSSNDFIPNLSAIDLVFNCGDKSYEILTRKY